MYLNPAFAGSTLDTRTMLQYRNQWIGLETPFSTVNVAFDQNSDRLRGGYGVYFINDRGRNINRSELSFVYSKEIEISSKWRIRAGAQGSFTYKYTDGSGFVYGDQLNSRNSNIGTSLENIPYATKFYPDLGAGGLLYSKKNWIGLSAHHLVMPNQSVISNQTIRQDIKLSLHGGTKIQLGGDLDEHSFSPCFQIKSQGNAFQTDIGAYYHRNFLLTGAWYRGLPLLSKQGSIQQDAFAFLVGFKSELLAISYSYDLPLTRMVFSTGSHEIVLQYEFDILSSKKPRMDRNKQKLPCPRF
jgi:type IX secretion system PorP/SprF family membrane protein